MLLRILFISSFLKAFTGYAQDPVVIEGYAQGTTFTVVYYDSLEINYEEQVLSLLRNFDQSVSTYVDTSIISKVNHNEAVMLDSTFIHCFEQAHEIWKITDGMFDPTVYPLVEAYGFNQIESNDPENIDVDSLLEFVGFEKIRIREGQIVKNDLRVQLDFNAFAQGYSVDLICQFLESKGIQNYLVEVGGELRLKGSSMNGRKWTISIEKPGNADTEQRPTLEQMELTDKAVASSGNYKKFYEHDGKKYVHEIDPKTGLAYPSNLLSVTVFADDCLTADAIATALMVMGYDRSIQFLKEHKEFRAILFYNDDEGMIKTAEINKGP